MRGKAIQRCAALILACGIFAGGIATPAARVQSKQSARGAEKKKKKETAAAVKRFSARAEAALGASPASKGEWGLLIADAATGETLYELNADKYFVPASNLKLFTTALALAKLGPDYRFHTTLETLGTISAEGTLSGDVFLVGRGDPNLSNRKFPYELKEEFDGPPEKVLAELADALVAKGVKEITGDMVGDDTYFPRERFPDGWEIGDMVWQYGAAISAIAVDDNTVTLTLTPGAATGDRVAADVAPPTPDFQVQHAVLTSASDAKPDLTLTREPGSNKVLVAGTLPANSAPRKLVLAIQEPALHAAALLKKLVEERGVKVDGSATAVHFPPGLLVSQERKVLAEHVSISLGDSVKLVNKISQNLHAEMLLRTAARQTGTWLKPEDLAKFPADFYAAAGIAAGDVVQADGSGLSRHDLVTPRAIVALLKYARAQPWFAPYYASLPVAGVDGTLEDRLKTTIAAGKIHAKTGSVEHVRTRSGFAETPAGRQVIFSFLSNNQSGKNHEAADALDALCVAMIEEFDPQAAAHGKKAAAKH